MSTTINTMSKCEINESPLSTDEEVVQQGEFKIGELIPATTTANLSTNLTQRNKMAPPQRMRVANEKASKYITMRGNVPKSSKSPLLLCHKNSLDGKIMPTDWSGNIFATHQVLHEFDQEKYMIQPSSIHTLCPNEVYNINMISDEECQYKSKNIEVTAIPWDTEYIIYLIKDDNIVNLLTDMITEDMTVFIKNKILRDSIKSGIDVLYLNDGIYHKSKALKIFPSECLLGALITLVQPRFVKGLINDEQLPHHIINCCKNLCCG